MSNSDKPETSTRPNFGETSELRNGSVTTTTVDPISGSQTVKTTPVQKPAK
ncbi:MAG TPA: hypothetical protein VN618_08165 [Solirubrobacteraceae bacterium]|nr:hypothetical protein [Solirubrobacteraceae bacterium]